VAEDPSTTPARVERIPLGVSDAGERLDRVLAGRVGLSRAEARRLLADGRVSLDGRVCGYADKGRILAGGGVLEVAAGRARRDQRALVAEEPGEGPDDARHLGSMTQVARLAGGPGWIAVDKPAGWPVHPLREDESGTVLNAVAAMHPEIHGVGDEGGLRSGVVHRLDVDTSGVLLFATNAETWRRLRAAFREHRVEKLYRAVVAGHPAEELAPASGAFGPRLELEVAVARHRPARVRVVDAAWRRAPRGYPARQRMRVVERFGRGSVEEPGAALVEFEIETGFLHQIRVISAHLGHPVIGDALYGNEASLAFGGSRQLLHAARLRFEEIEAESADPQDLRAMISRLRGSLTSHGG